MTTFLTIVLARTPIWVWFILVALIALGVRQMSEQTVTRRRLWAVPIGLGLYSFVGALQTFGSNALTALVWLAGLGLGVAVNQWWQQPRKVEVLADGRYRLGGSVLPMVLYVGIFCLRYVLGVLHATAPQLVQEASVFVPCAVLLGLSSGLLLARALRVLAPGRAMAAQPAYSTSPAQG